MFNIGSYTWFGNTIMDYFWFLVILIVGFLARTKLTMWTSTFVYWVTHRHSKTVGKQKMIQLLKEPLDLLLATIIVYLAFNQLIIPEEWHLVSREEFGLRFVLNKLFDLLMIFSGFWLLLRMIDFAGLIFLNRAKATISMADDQLVIFSKEAIKVLIAMIALFILIGTAFELDVVSLITGLGIGGLAFALAAKESLENLLGSFTIFLDKPFVTGDSVKVGSIEGTVESVGFRSTRIRSTDRMMVTVPNKKMVDAELINDTDRIVRRAAFSLYLNHDTTEEQTRKVVGEIRQLLNSNPLIESKTPVVRFRFFLEKGLEIFIVYIVLTSDNSEFLGIQEDMNFGIMRILRESGVTLAQPVTKS
jgi:MscS family membrane protein